MTTTFIKFVLIVEDDATSTDQTITDQNIKRLFVKLHRIFIEHMLNPFSNINAPITSRRFADKVQETVQAYNRTIIR